MGDENKETVDESNAKRSNTLKPYSTVKSSVRNSIAASMKVFDFGTKKISEIMIGYNR